MVVGLFVVVSFVVMVVVVVVVVVGGELHTKYVSVFCFWVFFFN